MSGILYLCATPIGNLEDMTFRAVRMLKEADLIAAEDTRNSIKLLNHFDIHTPMTSYHEHNRREKGPVLIEKLRNGENIVLITDAGMPAVSDPGEDLVRLCAQEGIEVRVVPGASASVSALALSGLDTSRFAFEGFLPVKNRERKQRLESIAPEKRTMIIYEAPHKLLKTLEDLCSTLGEDRAVSLCRELTKKHETVQRTTLGEARSFYSANEPRGEFVLVISGREDAEETNWNDLSVNEHIDFYISQGFDRKEAMKMAAKDRGVSKSELYREALCPDTSN